MTGPYYADDTTELWLGDCRELLPGLNLVADAAIVDPPYAETSLVWDQWPDGWPDVVAAATTSMWCFGSFRMFTERWGSFAPWRLSQDVIWEKQDGSGFATDRFRRVHEIAVHFYHGPWSAVRTEVPRTGSRGPDKPVRRVAVARGHHGERGASSYSDDGTRLMRSVIRAQNMHGRNMHPTEKSPAIVSPLLTYAVPPGGLVLDPMAGSCSTAVVAKLTGRRAVCIEANEAMCEKAAQRLSQGLLPFDEAVP